MKQSRPTVLYAAAVRDAAGVNASPGAVLVQDCKVISAGEPQSLPKELVEQAEVIDRPDDVLLPAMVNAHTHLELTDIGPQPYDEAGGFVGWVKMVREADLAITNQHSASQGGLAALKRGLSMMSLLAGVQAVGDIVPPERGIHRFVRGDRGRP
ncbi:MAG: hypothetical protein AAF085_17480, partial [Planctomycetota bacterium]